MLMNLFYVLDRRPLAKRSFLQTTSDGIPLTSLMSCWVCSMTAQVKLTSGIGNSSKSATIKYVMQSGAPVPITFFY